MEFIKFKYFGLIVWACLRKWFIVNPFLLYSQAYHETGNFKSKICKENLNLFGMKMRTGSRPTTGLGVKNGHAYYNSFYDSVVDYIYRQKNFNIKPQFSNNEKYIFDTVNSNYAEDPQYLTKWTTLNNKIQDKNMYLVILLAVIPFASLFFTGFFIYKRYFQW